MNRIAEIDPSGTRHLLHPAILFIPFILSKFSGLRSLNIQFILESKKSLDWINRINRITAMDERRRPLAARFLAFNNPVYPVHPVKNSLA